MAARVPLARLLPPTLDLEQLVPRLGDANRALARYAESLRGLPNPALILSPLSTREAVLSSRIEGTRATLQEVLEHEAVPSEDRRGDIREILNYRAALAAAVQELETRPLSLNLIRRAHKVLMEGVRGSARDPGAFRRVQNWIGPPGCTIEQATYVPPPPREVLPLLTNLEKYIHVDGDPVLQAGVLHAYFEAVHPFLDGNGRVGRMLIPLYLYSRGQLDGPAFYLSDYIERNRTTYYRLLESVTKEGTFMRWLEFFLEAVATQAGDDWARVRRVRELHSKMRVRLTGALRSESALRIIDALFVSPIFTAAQIRQLSGASRAVVHRALSALEEDGTVRISRPGGGPKPALWLYPDLFEIVK